MLRTLVWLFIYLVCFGFASFEVTYVDGLHIKLTGWGEKIGKKKRRRRKRARR